MPSGGENPVHHLLVKHRQSGSLRAANGRWNALLDALQRAGKVRATLTNPFWTRSTISDQLGNMPVFISYTHRDKEFVEDLAIQLVRNRVHVWIDRWELKVGDSLIQRVQGAIEGADALIVVLSKSAMKSEWCKKELSSGLIRELEERRVVVLPVIIDDCKPPLFIREKFYADFRKDKDKALGDVLEALACVTNDRRGRFENAKYDTDWSVDSSIGPQGIRLDFTLVAHYPANRHCVLTTITVLGDSGTIPQFGPLIVGGKGSVVHEHVLGLMNEVMEPSCDDTFAFVLTDAIPRKTNFVLGDKFGNEFSVYVVVRLLGEDSGKYVRLDFGGQIVNIFKAVQTITRDEVSEKSRSSKSKMKHGRKVSPMTGKRTTRNKAG
jgi:hypothetical protein